MNIHHQTNRVDKKYLLQTLKNLAHVQKNLQYIKTIKY